MAGKKWDRFKEGMRRGREAVENSEGFTIHQGNVYELHLKGWTPSEIDGLMCLPDGMSRELIVAYWHTGRRCL